MKFKICILLFWWVVYIKINVFGRKCSVVSRCSEVTSSIVNPTFARVTDKNIRNLNELRGGVDDITVANN